MIGKREGRVRRRYPLLNNALEVRMVDDDSVIDLRWRGYAVWEVRGRDSDQPTVMLGWEKLVSSLDFPVQILIRQHNPNLEGIRAQLRQDLPGYMRVPDIEQLTEGLDDLLGDLETRVGIVDRKFYVIADREEEAEMAGLLASSGFPGRLLTGDALRDLYVGCGSGMLAGNQRDRYQMVEKSHHLELNECRVRVYETVEWPRIINMNILQGLLMSGEELDVSLYIEPMGARESFNRLRTHKSRWEGAIESHVRKGESPPDESRRALYDVTRLLDDVQVGSTHLYSINLTLAAYGRTEVDFRRACEVVEGHFRTVGGQVRTAAWRQREGFAQLMPALRRGITRPLYRTDKNTVLRIYPFGPPDLDTRSGTMLFLCLRSRSPVFYDRFGAGIINAHTLIAGPTGTGKSFDGKVVMLREVARGIRGYVIDPAGEFANIASRLGGRVLEPGRPGYGLNPFGVRYQGESELREHGSQVCDLLEMMLEERIGIERRADIDRCVTGWYGSEVRRLEERGDLANSFVGLGGMTGFHQYLRSAAGRDEVRESGEQLAHLLQRFVTGTLSDLMGGDGISLLEGEAPITSLTMRSVPENLMPVATAACAQAVWSLAVSDSRKRLMLFDEIWMLLRTPAGSKLLMSIIRQARKYDLGIIAITQMIRDFMIMDPALGLAGGGGEAILANCHTKLLLYQPPDVLPLVQEKLGLSPSGVAWLQRADRGQGLFIVGEESFPVRIMATDVEKELIEDDSWRQRIDHFVDNERALVAP